MPPKIKELISQLKSAGFSNHEGNGRDRKFRHRSGVNIIISGETGADAKHYQIHEVNGAVHKLTKDA